MKGIILSGGVGSRLFPMTKAVSKQLLPIFDKPLIYYPLSVLMLANIREVLLITTPEDADTYKRVLGDGQSFGIDIQYAEQAEPNGLAEAFIIGEEFIGDDDICLILGDNLFYGNGLYEILNDVRARVDGAVIFGYTVNDPERFGVIELDSNDSVLSIEEKPVEPKSNIAATGLFMYSSEVVEIAKSVKPSARGELEITTVNNEFLRRGKLQMTRLRQGICWMDTGTPTSLLEASQFVNIVQSRQGLQIACLEEIGYRLGWVSMETMQKTIQSMGKTDYSKYLEECLLRGRHR